MNDTTDEISAKQFEIFFSKSPKERFLINLGLTEFIFEAARKRIKKVNPQLTENEVKANLFKEFYTENFSKEELEKILLFFLK